MGFTPVTKEIRRVVECWNRASLGMPFQFGVRSQGLGERGREKALGTRMFGLLPKFQVFFLMRFFWGVGGEAFLLHFTVAQFNKLTSVFHVCPLIDDDFCHNICQNSCGSRRFVSYNNKLKWPSGQCKKKRILFNLMESLSITLLTLIMKFKKFHVTSAHAVCLSSYRR